MTSPTKITVETTVNAPLLTAWAAWVEPDHITKWNFASDDWQCPWAKVDLKEGGMYSARMEAKDGSFGFEFGATYTKVIPMQQLDSTMEDGRTISVTLQRKTARRVSQKRSMRKTRTLWNCRKRDGRPSWKTTGNTRKRSERSFRARRGRALPASPPATRTRGRDSQGSCLLRTG